MDSGFSETAPIEAGFGRVFEQEIRPKLAAIEARRGGHATGVWRDAKWIAVAAAIVFVGILGMFGWGAWWTAPVVAVAAAVVAVYAGVRRQRRWQDEVIASVMPVFCRFLGDIRYEPTAPLEVVQDFEALGLVGASRHRRLVHRLEGSHRGTRFKCVHAELLRTRGRGRAGRVFHGLLFRIAVPVPPPAPIMIAPREDRLTQVLAGVARSRLPPSFEHIELGDPGFERRFQVLSPAEGPAGAERVRGYLTPDVRAALLEINASEGRLRNNRAALAAAFDGDTFYLALSRYETVGVWPLRFERPRPFLSVGSFLGSGDLEEAIHEMFHDVEIAYRVIDCLHGAERQPGVRSAADRPRTAPED